MHGELLRSRCERPGCGEPFDDARSYMTAAEIPRCDCGARIRPHICWFGEVPFEMDRIERALAACDWFLTIGSSGSVYPAAGFVHALHARKKPSRKIYVGLEAPENAAAFDEVVLGKAGLVVPSLFAA